MVRYILFAVLVLVGVTLMITSLRGGSSSPSADATASGPPAATPAKSGGAVVAPPGASASQHPSPAGPATVTASSNGGGGSGGGAVTSVEITALTPDHPGSKAYIAHLHVLTNGPGPVTVTLTVAGSTIVGLPGSVQTRTFPIILSGQTTYDYAKVLDADSFCPAPYLGVKASAPGVSSSYKATTSAC